MQLSIVNGNVRCKVVSVDSIERLTEIITSKDYCLGTFKCDYRNATNFIQAKAIGLDFDNNLTIGDAVKEFAEYRNIIAPSRSHQKDKNGIVADRFRVILFLSTPITDLETFEATWLSLAMKWPKLDKSCKDASRLYYKSQYVHSMKLDGLLVDPVSPQPKAIVDTQAVADLPPVLKGKLSQRTQVFLEHGAPDGNKHQELYVAAVDANEQGYPEAWFRDRVRVMVESTGISAFEDANASKTISDAFSVEPKYEPRVKPRAFKLMSIADMYKDKTEVEWLVDELLMVGGLSLISADPKAGKSTVCRQLVRDVLRGGNFFGRRCKQGAVHYYGMEEHAQTLKSSFRKLEIADDDNLLVHVGDVLTDTGFSDFREITCEAKPALVVVDTLFDLVEVVNENSYQEVKTKLRKLRQIARDSGSHILAVHHNNKSGGQQDNRRGNARILGSQAILGAMDAVMVLELEGKNRKISSSGRDIKGWYQRMLVFDNKAKTYSLGPETVEDWE